MCPHACATIYVRKYLYVYIAVVCVPNHPPPPSPLPKQSNGIFCSITHSSNQLHNTHTHTHIYTKSNNVIKWAYINSSMEIKIIPGQIVDFHLYKHPIRSHMHAYIPYEQSIASVAHMARG